MKKTGVYKIQSTIKSKRSYIGSSIDINRRKQDHLKNLRKNIHHSLKLQRHYNKYGESDLQFSILLGCEKEDLIKIEQYFIDSYKPYFNCSPTAGNCLGVKHSIKTKKKLSNQRIGQKNNFYGKHHSEETKQKNREAHLGKLLTDEHKQNIGKGHLGQKRSEIAKYNMSEAQKRRVRNPASEETKKKMSEAQKKQWKIKKSKSW